MGGQEVCDVQQLLDQAQLLIERLHRVVGMTFPRASGRALRSQILRGFLRRQCSVQHQWALVRENRRRLIPWRYELITNWYL